MLRLHRFIPGNFLKALPLLVAAVICLPSASAQTVIYEQNFEMPERPCNDLLNTARVSSTRLQDDFGSAFRQLNSADVLCITPPAPGQDNYTDPLGTAGKYSIGFYGSIDTANTEAVGMAFDPAGQPFINGSVDLAHIKLANYIYTPTSDNIGSPASLTLAYYRLHATTLGGLPVSDDFRLGTPASMGGLAVVQRTSDNAVLTPLHSETATTTNRSGNPYAMDWKRHTFSVDTSSFAEHDRLVVVFTGLALHDYVAIDNLRITTNTTPTTPLQVSKTFSVPTVQPGQSSQVTIDIQGNNVGDTLGLTLKDTLPSPLVLASIASNTCAGTATTAGNSFSLTGGTVPAAGCQVVLNATWPATDYCSVASVTNTIVDGSDFSFGSGAPTAGVNATAQLACKSVPLQVSKTFGVASVKPGDTTQVTINLTGNGVGDTTGLTLADKLPAPLTLDSVTSNSCGGTTTTAGNSLGLTGGTVPAAGCTVVLGVTWPAADLCTVATVTNTITDGADFSFSTGAPTAGVNATAQLACSKDTVPPVANVPAVPLGGLWAWLGMALALLAAAWRAAPSLRRVSA